MDIIKVKNFTISELIRLYCQPRNDTMHKVIDV